LEALGLESILEKLTIEGGRALRGKVTVSGAKNAAVAIIPAALLVDGVCTVENVPNIKDVNILTEIMTKLGAKIAWVTRNELRIDSRNIKSSSATFDIVKSLRASYYLLGALIGRFNSAQVAFPGGCDFGHRPIDQHIKGFKALGANVEDHMGVVTLKAECLQGSKIFLDVVSVGATINLMLASVMADGVTIIENPAKEPHIVDVANFLNAMGANVKGAGTDEIKITGVARLVGGTSYSIIPDQIEAGTFMIAAAASKGDVVVHNLIPKHMESLTAKLLEMNVLIESGDDWIRVTSGEELTPSNVKTMPYPGFPTDLQPLISVLLCLANGSSTLTEAVWDSRFQYVDELKKMGANIRVDGRTSYIQGVETLMGASLKSLDLRAGAALIIAAIAAKGSSSIYNVNYVDRGYEDIEGKLVNLGALISRQNISIDEYSANAI
jgi:UDP-N-acetylglucosamine 1-carboxyvinyltransferase